MGADVVKTVWICADNIISPLGKTSEENFQSVQSGKSGVTPTEINGSEKPYSLGKIKYSLLNDKPSVSFFDELCIESITDALRHVQLDVKSERVIIILSTTKGNIELLRSEGRQSDALPLYQSAKAIAKHFKNPNIPIVVSNACISGVMALQTAAYLLESDQYDHAVVVGADVLSHFVVSGFQSLYALSPEICKPFDKERKGINLGEAAATIILSTSPESLGAKKEIAIRGGGLTNDANHISGPSRTGEELGKAIQQALLQSNLSAKEVDYISSHGTATIYNDEMEAKAIHLAGLSHVPMNSLKGYFGHTLGAAGIVESVISIKSMQHNTLIASFGFIESGVSQPINIIQQTQPSIINTVVKTASGFGGCNAAIVFQKCYG